MVRKQDQTMTKLLVYACSSVNSISKEVFPFYFGLLKGEDQDPDYRLVLKFIHCTLQLAVYMWPYVCISYLALYFNY